MLRSTFKSIFLVLGLTAAISFHTPQAHASWVSHWLGLDHHTSTPQPTPIPSPVQVTYVQPAPIIIQPATQTYVAATAAPSPVQTQHYTATSLPTTGPETSLGLFVGIFALSLYLVQHVVRRSKVRTARQSIDIL